MATCHESKSADGSHSNSFQSHYNPIACNFIWSVSRTSNDGRGIRLPMTLKKWHRQADKTDWIKFQEVHRCHSWPTMCGNIFMPDSVTSACRFMWSIRRSMKIGTGNELPDACFMWQASGKPSLRYGIAVPILGRKLRPGHSDRKDERCIILLGNR